MLLYKIKLKFFKILLNKFNNIFINVNLINKLDIFFFFFLELNPFT
jgi:hypothetical protein